MDCVGFENIIVGDNQIEQNVNFSMFTIVFNV